MTSAEPKKKREKTKLKRQSPEVVLIPVSGEPEVGQLKRYLCSLINELKAEKRDLPAAETRSQPANNSASQGSR